jgi:hypothetical protein
MKKFLLALALASSTAFAATDLIPAKRIFMPELSFIAPSTQNVDQAFRYINDRWPTNINIGVSYWPEASGKSFVTTQGYAKLSAVSNAFMPGTNFSGASLSNGVWTITNVAEQLSAFDARISAMPGVADYLDLVSTTTDGWFRATTATNVDAIEYKTLYTSWAVANHYTNLITYTDGAIAFPTGYVAIVYGYGKIRVMSTNQVSVKLCFFNKDNDENITYDSSVVEYLYDIDDYYDSDGANTGWRYGTRSGFSTFFKITRENEKRIAMGAVFDFGVARANTGALAMWKNVNVLLFKIPTSTGQ